MSDSPHFKLPAKLDKYLAALSRIYESKRKTLYEEIVVNSTLSVDEGATSDNWNQGTFGHGVILSIPESIFVRAMDVRETVCKELAQDLNALNSVQNEFVCSVAIDMKLPENSDWRARSKAYQISSSIPKSDAHDLERIWGTPPLRLFLSHKSSVKVETSCLKKALESLGMSGFVAHEDIEPTLEWHREIERALFSMDALVALLTEDYHDSQWTDQEVGVAIGRGVPIIAIRLGEDPYGLMGKGQGLGGCSFANPGIMAAKIFAILSKLVPDNSRLFDAALSVYSQSKSFDSSGEAVNSFLAPFESLSEIQITRLLAAYEGNGQNKHSFRGREALKPLLKKWTGKTWVVANDLLVLDTP